MSSYTFTDIVSGRHQAAAAAVTCAERKKTHMFVEITRGSDPVFLSQQEIETNDGGGRTLQEGGWVNLCCSQHNRKLAHCHVHRYSRQLELQRL